MGQVVVILGHPVSDSYCRGLAEAVVKGVSLAAHKSTFIDLSDRERRRPFGSDDHGHFSGGPLPQDVEAYQQEIAAANGLVFVYPIYWWTMPDCLRSFIDRVFTAGWAYAITDGPSKALLEDKPCQLITTAGASAETIETFGYGKAMRRLIDEGTFAYCGLKDVRSFTVYDVHDSPQIRAEGLRAVHDLGRHLLDY